MNTKKLVYTAAFLALGIIFPGIFHLLGLPGQVLLPMHVPIFLAALTLGPLSGLIVGVLTPILSSLLTGMPPMVPMVPIMVFELAAYGFFAGFLYGKYPKNIFIPILGAMVIGRIVAGIAAYVVFNMFNMEQINILTFIGTSFVKSIPGIIMILVLVPLLYKWMPREVKNS